MTTENNKIIAEFMEAKQYDKEDNYIYFDETNNMFSNDTISIKDLKFHNDWNWLMEVIKKIESLKHCQVDISLNWCRVNYKDVKFNYDSRTYFKGLTKIQAVYNACLEFIKWYNEQKK